MKRRKLGSLGLKHVALSMSRVVPVTLLMAVFVYVVVQNGQWGVAGDFWYKLLLLGFAVIGGGGLYAVGCIVMRVPEASQASEFIKRKLQRQV